VGGASAADGSLRNDMGLQTGDFKNKTSRNEKARRGLLAEVKRSLSKEIELRGGERPKQEEGGTKKKGAPLNTITEK